MTKTAFVREIGDSAKSLSGFLGTHGPMNGSGFAAYGGTWEFFKKREMAGIKPPVVKKQKVGAAGNGSAAAPDVPDLSDIFLPGEDDDVVTAFDTCDEVRSKINAHLKKPGMTKAQLCRDIYAQLKVPSKPGKPSDLAARHGVTQDRDRGAPGQVLRRPPGRRQVRVHRDRADPPESRKRAGLHPHAQMGPDTGR
ncbi:hypothetical protein N657DRAFT_563838 [Parathielavia appendiculata]|uniref:DUF7726 domain-containing protein n=1 Tax=Parathielavia appendiculata TaxID=2587402 RepID=A0AAN6UAG7_9PEZI|nr:hypothetical protein N657DRAFT_563838 [Parathielavia appendiculata]